MKCRTCGQKAVINMRQHKLGLCKDHYLDWLPIQTNRFIKKYEMFSRKERVLVAVSGGKDSLSLWDILIQSGYQTEGIHINLGINRPESYSDDSVEKCLKFSGQRSVQLHIISIDRDFNMTIPKIADQTTRGRNKTCSSCGLVKRYILNKFALDHGFDVLSTGHNLDDETATLFSNTLQWRGEFMIRQAPVLPASNGLVKKVKPLCRFYEREMAAYAILSEIDFLQEECAYSANSTSIYYKNHFNLLEHHNPGEKLRFYLHFLKTRDEGLFAPVESIKQELHECPSCGQVTSSTGYCSFCRLVEIMRSN